MTSSTAAPSSRGHDALMRNAVTTAVLASLSTTGVLERLCDGPATVDELARDLELDRAALDRSLALLHALDYLERRGDAYAWSRRVEDAGRDGPIGTRVLLKLMQMLPGHLKDGATLLGDLETRGEGYRRATPGLGRMWTEAAKKLADALGPAPRILDVGAGAGPWSLAMAKESGAHVTALDLPPVLEVFEQNARALGVAHRTVGASYFEAELEPVYDRIILANVVHLESEANARRLVERASRWLAPGGELVIVDAFGSVADNVEIAVYALHLGLRVAGGQVHAEEAMRSFCESAGLVPSPLIVLEGRTGLAALRARR